MATRHHGRMSVVSLLYAEAMGGGAGPAEFFEQHKIRNALLEWSQNLLTSVQANREQIDAALAEHIDIAATGAVDLAILRLGAAELLFSDTDKAVIINEAILLAKDFSSETSTGLINGVLDKLRQ